VSDITEVGRPQYGKGSNANYFRDLLAAKSGGAEGDEARTRIATARGALEARTSNLELSLSHQGSDFSPNEHLNASFVDSATRALRIEPLFQRNELPDTPGETLKIPRLSASVTPTSGLDAAILATATPTTASVSAPVATVSALLTVSQQWIDLVMAPGGETIAGDILGGRYAEAVDLQLASGTGASGQTIGLDATTSPTAFTFASASPTVPLMLTAIMKTRAQVAKARGVVPDAVVMHPTLSWFIFDGGASTDVNIGALQIAFPRIVESSAISIALGAGTASEIILACTRDLQYWSRPPVISVAEDYSGTNTLQLAIAVHGYVASPGANLNPTGLGLITGTGTTAQTGFGA
jgi:hypothetical protein